jgi:hypothetical protein
MTGKHTRRAGATLRTLQMAAFPCPAKPSERAATKRARSLNDQFQARLQETSTMTTICTRPYPDDGAAATGRAATMPPFTGPGLHGQASRTRLRLAVAAAGGLLAAGTITLAAVAASGATADRAPHRESALGSARPGTATTLTSRANPSTAGGPVTYAATVRAGLVLSRFTRRHVSIYPVWSTTMPTNTRSPQSRPHGALACCLARPASLRVTALGRQPQQRLTHRTGKSWS